MNKFKQICRSSIQQSWGSNWFIKKKDKSRVSTCNDTIVRELLQKELDDLLIVCSVHISRSSSTNSAKVFCAKTSSIKTLKSKSDELAAKIKKLTQDDFVVEIIAITNPSQNPHTIVCNIKKSLLDTTNVTSIKKAIIKEVEFAQKHGAGGVLVEVKGRIRGARIARKERFSVGKLPRNNFESSIQFAHRHCISKSGLFGISCYVYVPNKKHKTATANTASASNIT